MYFQYPALYGQYVAFVSGNSLWLSLLDTGRTPLFTHRLTEALPGLIQPRFSEDGKTIAFVSGRDVYSVSLQGGVPERLTAHERDVELLGWKDADHLWILTNALSTSLREYTLATIHKGTGERQPINIGPCEFSSLRQPLPGEGQNPEATNRGEVGQVIQRQGHGYISWKRYRGGTAGTLWIDAEGRGQFQPLLPHIEHNLLSPLWIGDRIYFLSDKDGHGNIYSCTPQGHELRQHTHHRDFYPRHLSAHGQELIYSCGGKIWIYHIENHQSHALDLKLDPGALGKVREVKDPKTHLSHYALSPDGKRLALTTRGRLFDLTPFKGPSTQRGKRDGVRYRWATWFSDKTLVTLYDQGLQETIECYGPEDLDPLSQHPAMRHEGGFAGQDWGRITSAKAHPHERILACTNHRHELLILTLGEDRDISGAASPSSQDPRPEQTTLVHASTKGPLCGYDWSPCGRWLAYATPSRLRGSHIVIYDTLEKKNHEITDNAFENTNPVFDPEGKYLFFLSSRCFDPQKDGLDMTMMCDAGTQPFVFILQEGQESPFALPLLGHGDKSEDTSGKTEESKDTCEGDTKVPGESQGEDSSKEKETVDPKVSEEKKGKEDKKPPTPVLIDFEHTSARILSFPLPPRDYTHVFALRDQLLYTLQEESGKNELYAYDLKTLKEESWITEVDSVVFSMDRQWMTYASHGKLRTVRASGKPDDTPDVSFHQGGWLDWKRIALSVNPQREWIHMFDEAWRLQREMFWTPSMGQIDWQEIYDRYRPCIDAITCQSELYSVINDMQGELGTSHAYVMQGGKSKSHSSLGSLGADLSYDPEHNAYRIDGFLQGDSWHPTPLQRPGLGIKKGDLIFALGGQSLSRTFGPQHALVQQAGQSLPMVVGKEGGEHKRTVVVFPQSASKEPQWRYRQWVEGRRQWVHEHSQGKVGYLHIPDMQTLGYAEFLRGYTQDFDREGLIVDARYNGGGNLSYFMIDILRRQRLGHDQSRHHGLFPYPSDSPRGPMVALINEHTGSDGDIFAYAFKNFRMGELVGKRTWGGVVGIWPRYSLMDGTYTSQPEFSFWFHDMGWGIENKGVSPTIEVDITPQDYAQKKDPQLERALQEALLAIERDKDRQRTLLPAEGSEPCLAAPTL